jgi:hypothetical protein
MDLEVAVPYLSTTSDYTINGRILVLPIVGSGDSWANYSMYKQMRKAIGLFLVQTNTGVTLGGATGVGKMYLTAETNDSRNYFRTITGLCKYREMKNTQFRGRKIEVSQFPIPMTEFAPTPVLLAKLRLSYRRQWIFVQSGTGVVFKICGASVNCAKHQRSDSGTAPINT